MKTNMTEAMKLVAGDYPYSGLSNPKSHEKPAFPAYAQNRPVRLGKSYRANSV